MNYLITYYNKETKIYSSLECPLKRLGKDVRNLASKNSEVIIESIELIN